MAGVRGGLFYKLAAPGVPLPDQAWVASECLRGSQFLRLVPGPETGLGVAESWDTTLGGDAGAGEDGDASRVLQRGDEALGYASRCVYRSASAQTPRAFISSPGPSVMETVRCSPVAISRREQTPAANSSSPMTTAYRASPRSACLNCPLALRLA